jgi:hypothetical protein
VAQEVGLLSVIERLQVLSLNRPTDIDARLEYLRLKQEITDTVLTASLQVRDVTARIDREVAQMARIREKIQDRTNRGVTINALANGVGGGALNEIGQAGEMGKNELPGEIIQLVAGGVNTFLSGLAIKQQSGGKRRLERKPGLLAKVFDMPTDAESDYPPLVWRYLNNVPPGNASHLTRLELLRNYWLINGFAPDVRKSAGKRQAAILSGEAVDNRVTMSALDDRTALLQDLRAEVLQIDRALLDLLLATRSL